MIHPALDKQYVDGLAPEVAEMYGNAVRQADEHDSDREQIIARILEHFAAHDWPMSRQDRAAMIADVVLERRADSTIQAAGGHRLHVEGGAEMMWQQVGSLTLAFREASALVDFLRAHTCRNCGEPSVLEHDGFAPSPFLKYAIQEDA